MPLYEYQCATCKAVTELLVLGDDAPTAKCSQCGGTDLRRLFSPMSILGGKVAERYACDSCDAAPSCGTDRACCPGCTR